MAMTALEAAKLVGGSKQILKNQKLALSICAYRNTPEENARLEACSVALRNYPAFLRAKQELHEAKFQRRA